MSNGTSTNAIVVLVIGILSWILCPFVLGLAAWIMGNSALASGYVSESDRTLIQVGRILGMINVILTLIGFALWLLALFGLIGLGFFIPKMAG